MPLSLRHDHELLLRLLRGVGELRVGDHPAEAAVVGRVREHRFADLEHRPGRVQKPGLNLATLGVCVGCGVILLDLCGLGALGAGLGAGVLPSALAVGYSATLAAAVCLGVLMAAASGFGGGEEEQEEEQDEEQAEEEQEQEEELDMSGDLFGDDD